MSELHPRDSNLPAPASRRGGSTMFFLLGLLILIAILATVLVLSINLGSEDTKDQPLLATVTREHFQHVVLENGEVESAENVEVRCEVRARTGGGRPGPSTTIIDVVPEGTLVKTGDWLITFDSSNLEREKLAEQIIMNTMEAEMIDAHASYEAALFDKEEFLARGAERIKVNLTANASVSRGSSASRSGSSSRGSSSSSGSGTSQGRTSSSNRSTESRANSVSSTSNSAGGTSTSQTGTSQSRTRSASQQGSSQRSADGERAFAEVVSTPIEDPTYGELKRFIENEIFTTEANLKKARLHYDSTKRMVARGLAGETRLESERFRLQAAQNSLDLAKQKLDVLENYTKKKLVVQLEGNFEAAKVQYESAKRSFELQRAKVEEIGDQIAKCRVVAPAGGQVVYKNVQSRRAANEFVVEPGSPVFENQVIIVLPDPTKMQVRALIDESDINLVRSGMPATIQIDAFDSIHLGTVTKVNEYAESTSWFNAAGGKQYLTLIRLLDLPPTIRVGLTAEVSIFVEERADALQMPFQTVYEQGGKAFCLVKKGNQWETREIVISSTNGKTVVLDEESSEAIRVGDLVAMNPTKHLDLFDKSRLPKDVRPSPASTRVSAMAR